MYYDNKNILSVDFTWMSQKGYENHKLYYDDRKFLS